MNPLSEPRKQSVILLKFFKLWLDDISKIWLYLNPWQSVYTDLLNSEYFIENNVLHRRPPMATMIMCSVYHYNSSTVLAECWASEKSLGEKSFPIDWLILVILLGCNELRHSLECYIGNYYITEAFAICVIISDVSLWLLS